MISVERSVKHQNQHSCVLWSTGKKNLQFYSILINLYEQEEHSQRQACFYTTQALNLTFHNICHLYVDILWCCKEECLICHTRGFDLQQNIHTHCAVKHGYILCWVRRYDLVHTVLPCLGPVTMAVSLSHWRDWLHNALVSSKIMKSFSLLLVFILRVQGQSLGIQHCVHIIWAWLYNLKIRSNAVFVSSSPSGSKSCCCLCCQILTCS